MNFTRVIAGRFKGRKIALPESGFTRPTKSIVRGSIFDTLLDEVASHPFVELFAGSGSVGLEAASRGCEKVIFLERDPAALKTLEENIRSLGFGGAEVIGGDTFKTAREVIDLLRKAKQRAWFYADAPFGTEAQTETLIAALPPDVAHGVIVEHISGYKPPCATVYCDLIKKRRFGRTSISYYKCGYDV
ncbi:MAG: RsmD family RNA methyltransferase [Helicobacteraceae bacterium]|jgi:16S rRNA (guanine(966)-N(2))-methyltransferase RsmD|nr:RsmD family RNA methyltransferase [Helicobacteraceae bacterium]